MHLALWGTHAAIRVALSIVIGARGVTTGTAFRGAGVAEDARSGFVVRLFFVLGALGVLAAGVTFGRGGVCAGWLALHHLYLAIGTRGCRVLQGVQLARRGRGGLLTAVVVIAVGIVIIVIVASVEGTTSGVEGVLCGQVDEQHCGEARGGCLVQHNRALARLEKMINGVVSLNSNEFHEGEDD